MLNITLEKEEDVRLIIYDQAGRQLKILTKGKLPKGSRSFKRDASGTKPGIHIAHMIKGNRSYSIKLIKE